MKFKKIILISIFLLAILTIGFVSASEDINQTLAVDDDADLVSDIDEDTLSDSIDVGTEKKDAKINFLEDEDTLTILKGEDDYVYLDINTDIRPNGNLKIDVDNKEVYNEPASFSNQILYSTLTKNLGNSFGLHDITIKFYNDTIYNDYTNTWKLNYNYYKMDIPNTIKGDYDSLSVYFSPDAAGKVTLTVDSKKISTEKIEYGSVYFYLDKCGLGKHSYKVKFESSKNTKVYKSFEKSGSFNLEYMFDVEAENSIGFRDTLDVEVYLPVNIQNEVTVSYNGKTQKYKPDEEGMLYFEIKDLKLGENKINITYPGDKNYPAQTKELIVNVNEIFDLKEHVGYQSDDGIYLDMPEDAKGDLIVIVDDISKNYPIKNGKVNVSLSNYSMGVHNIYVNYTGDDYAIKGYNGTFKIGPNFIYPSKHYNRQDLNFSILLPEDATGKFRVSYENLYKYADVVDGKATVTFKNLNEINYDVIFKVEYFDGNYDDYDANATVWLVNTPNDVPLEIRMNDKILINKDYEEEYAVIYAGDEAEGYFNISIDGKYLDTEKFGDEYSGYYSIHRLVENLTLGNHTIQVDYFGDDYYTAKSTSKTFEMTYYSFSDERYITEEYAGYSVELTRDATGNLTLYIDGKKMKYDYEFDDMQYTNVYYFDLSSISCGKHDAKLVYSGDKKYKGFTKQYELNLLYEVICDIEEEYYYGDEVYLHFVFPFQSKENVKITVGDQVFTKNVVDYELAITVDNLTAVGKYDVTLEAPAGEKWSSETYNWSFNIIPHINIPEFINIIDGGQIKLLMPDDAKGSLNVSVYDKGILLNNYIQKVENGSAIININCNKLGFYQIAANYIGDDYNVSEMVSKFEVTPKINYTSEMYVGKTGEVTFEMPEDANGILFLYLNGIKLNTSFKNGKATATIPPLYWQEDNENYLNVVYYNDTKYGSYMDESNRYISILRYEPTIKTTLPKEIIANNYITITFTFPSDATGYIELDDAYAKLSKGKAVVKILVKNAGKNSYSLYYSGNSKYDSIYKTVSFTALTAPKLTMKDVTVYYKTTAKFKVKVVDSYGKLVKGKYVAFYVNGKKIKSVKTNSKGYATLKLSKTPKTYTVKATYKGGSVTKKLTVKHLVNLKTVKVKKSAKKLVLKVTLKKGKNALKGKKITFKFKGKKYTAKTSKKGVAKVTIKKKVLKKLKVGKKVTYQATYIKDLILIFSIFFKTIHQKYN